MRAAFPVFVGCVVAALAVSAPSADAEYPFDDLPSLPPLPGVRTAAHSDVSSPSAGPRQVVTAGYEDSFAYGEPPRHPGYDNRGYAYPPGYLEAYARQYMGGYPSAYPQTDVPPNITRRMMRRMQRMAAKDRGASDPTWANSQIDPVSYTRYDPAYDPGYGPEYAPQYDPTYDPVYEPEYDPDYGPEYDPDYGPLDEGGVFDRPSPVDRVFAERPPIWGGYIAGTYMPGTDRSIWNAEWFLPLWQDGRNLWFFNLRGQVDDDDAGEFNVGTGFRTLAWPGWVFGTYVFYDRLDSAYGNGFDQATLGVEAMDVFWDFRFNVYFPESKAKAASTPASAAISEGTIVVRSGIERAYWGFDLEAGHLLWTWGPNAQHEFRGFLGVYHFDHSAEGFDSITGPRLRLEWRWYDLPLFGLGSRLTCGLTAQADTERGGDLFAFTGLRIPLGFGAHAGRPLTPLERRMLDPVVRDVDVVSNSIQRVEPAVNSHTGEIISRVHVLDKTDDLAESIAALDNNAVVVIDGSKGQISSDAPIPLQPGQTVVGGGTRLDVQGGLSGKKAMWTAPGSRPTIEFGTPQGSGPTGPGKAPPTTAGFRMADDTRLMSVNTRGGRPAVLIDGVEHVTLSDVDIRDAQGAGIALHNAQHVTIDHASIDGVGSGTYVPNGWTNPGDQSHAFWSGSVHQGSGIAGVQSSDVTIRNSHIQDTKQAGVKFFKSQDITVEDSVIEDTKGAGLSFLKTENVTVRNVELHDVGTYDGPWSESVPPDWAMPDDAGAPTDMPSTDWALKRAGIELRQTQHTRIENLTIRGGGTYGVFADGAVDTLLDSVDITGVDNGMWFRNSQDVFVSGADITLPDLGPHLVPAPPEIGWFNFLSGETVAQGDDVIAIWESPAQYHGIVLTEVTGSAAISDSHIGSGSSGLGIWTRNTQEGALNLTINNVTSDKPLSIEARGLSEVAARVWDNQIGGDGLSVNVDVSSPAFADLKFLDNQFNGRFDALAVDASELNLLLQGNQLNDGPHRIANRNDASLFLRYRNNQSADEVLFESMGDVFGLAPLTGNDHTPTQTGEFTPIAP